MDELVNENAQQSLEAIQNTIARTRRASVARGGSPFVVLWGLLLTMAYVCSYLYPRNSAVAFWVMTGVGIVGTILLCWLLERKTPFKEPAVAKINLRMFVLWGTLYLYVVIWLNLLTPVNGIKMNAFILTVTMFGMIIIGLWFTVYFMVWLGLFVTAVTIMGVYLLPHCYYCIWMAIMAGGVMFGTGLYTSLRWR